MSHVVHLDIAAPATPKGWSAPSASSKTISPLADRKLIPAGPAYLEHVRRVAKQLSFEAHDAILATEEARLAALAGPAVEDDLGVGEEEETRELLALDPKEWKKQDHYAVLGLSHLRYTATPEQIKIAHRKKVLKHHPDKKSSATGGGQTNDDSFFKCCAKAFDVLMNAERRRQFDSADPHYLDLEEDAPTAAAFKGLKADAAAARFFREFGPVFEREARFSKTQPVPLLGENDSPKQAVEGFYDFWYNFDSWRSFEYYDKEVNEGSDSRDDKRYTEKKNKTERARRKKEDIARLRGLVDLALSLDPRIARIKQDEKDARAAKKAARSGTATPTTTKADAEEQKRKAAEEAAKKEEEDKVARELAKKDKAAQAKARKEARRKERLAEGEA